MNTAPLFAACVLIWGTTWYAITLQLAAAEPAIGVALRFSIAAVLIFGWCIARGHRLAMSRSAHAWVALLGLLNFFASYLFVYYAEQHIVSGLVAVGYSAMPLVNMALARLMLATPMSTRVGLGGLLGVVGDRAQVPRISRGPVARVTARQGAVGLERRSGVRRLRALAWAHGAG